jgi:photosystem II stability/assembly factor-like uncharacterized protein
MAALLAAMSSPVSRFVVASESLILPLASESTLLDIADIGDRLVAVGEFGHILYSDNEGMSWTQARVPTRQMLTAVSFPSARRGWAVGHDGVILATIDGGENWTIQRDGLRHQQQLNQEEFQRVSQAIKAHKEMLLLAGSASERLALQQALEDLELDLEDAEWAASEPVQAPPLLDVFFTDELRGVATGAFNTLLLTSDGGASWNHSPGLLDNPEEFHLNAVTGDGQGNLWIAAEGGLLFRSEDAGRSWKSLASPYAASWFGIARAPQSGTLLVFGLRGTIYRSLDAGVSWQSVESQSQRSISGGAFVTDQYVLLAGSVGTLLLSEDGGLSFRDRALPSRVNLSAVLYAGEEVIAVGQGGIHRGAGFGGRR